MNARLLNVPTTVPKLLLWAAQISGLILFVGWVVYVCNELVRNHLEMPDLYTFYQAAALMVVFAGYYVLRRHVWMGSGLAILGTMCFFAISFATSGVWPHVTALWFLAPAVLALVAWNYRLQQVLRHRQSP